MKRLLVLAAALAMLAGLSTAVAAYQFELGTATGSWVGNTWSGTFSWDTSSKDWHLWDANTFTSANPDYTTAEAYAAKHHKFSNPTSGTWTFQFTNDGTSFAVKDHSTGTTTTANWAIFLASNAPIRGGSVNASTGALTSDGLLHWYTGPATPGSGGVYDEDYSNQFNFVMNQAGTSVTVYANSAAVPEPMSIMLGIMGLGSIAGFKRLRKK